MPYYEFQWTDEIINHLAEHGVSPEDFEEVVSNPHAPRWRQPFFRVGRVVGVRRRMASAIVLRL